MESEFKLTSASPPPPTIYFLLCELINYILGYTPSQGLSFQQRNQGCLLGRKLSLFTLFLFWYVESLHIIDDFSLPVLFIYVRGSDNDCLMHRDPIRFLSDCESISVSLPFPPLLFSPLLFSFFLIESLAVSIRIEEEIGMFKMKNIGKSVGLRTRQS